MDAFTDLLGGMINLVHLANREKDINLRREAPPNIQRRAERAKPIPRELYEVACKITRGDWPGEIRFNAESTKRNLLSTDISMQDLLLKTRN